MDTINEGIKKAAKDSVIYLIGNLALAISGVFSLKLYTHYFTPSQNGDYSLVISTISLIISIVFGWISNAVIRFTDYYVNKTDSENEYYITIVSLVRVINVVMIILYLLFLLIFKKKLGSLYLLSFVSIFLFVPQSYSTVMNNVLRATRKARAYTYNNIIISIGKLAFVYILVRYFKSGVESIIIAMIISYGITCIVCIKSLKFGKYTFSFKISKEILSKSLNYGVPLLGLSFTTWLLSVSDRYIIRIYGTSTQVGIYNICYSLGATIFNMINSFMMLGAYPIIVKMWNNEGREKTEKLISKLLKYYFYVTIPCLFGVISLGKPLMRLMSTKEYLVGYDIFIVVSFGIILLGVTNYVNKAWELSNKTYMILILNFIAAAIDIILNFMFIPIYGYKVAAYTTAIAYGVYWIISSIASRKAFVVKINIVSLIKTTIASVVMAAVGFILARFVSNIILLLFIGFVLEVIVYFVIMWLFKEINDEAKAVLNKFVFRSNK